MDPSNLVDMANRIGRFFAAQPDRAEALEGIARHIRLFWERRMRSDLLAYVDGHAGEGLDPIVLDALREHRKEL